MNEQPPFELRAFVTQLRRRRVFRVAGVYLVGAFALIQGANAILDMAGAPAWVARADAAHLRGREAFRQAGGESLLTDRPVTSYTAPT